MIPIEHQGDKQRDQIWRFWKVFGNKFVYKSSPKRVSTYGDIFKNITFCKNSWAIYLDNFRKHLG